MRVDEESFAMGGRAVSHLHGHVLDDGGRWTSGTILCPEGVVAVVIGGDYTRFDTVVNGRHHLRTERRDLSARGAVTAARRWLRSLAPTTGEDAR